MLTLKAIVDRLNEQGIPARLEGDEDCPIESVAAFTHAAKGAITFLANPRYKKCLLDCAASAVLVRESEREQLPMHAIVVDNPHVAFAHVAGWLYAQEDSPAGIHPTATIDPQSRIHPTASIGAHCVVEAGVVVGADCRIGPGCVLGRNVQIAEQTRLSANVTLCHGSQIGRRVILHPGVVIGADGFGLANDKGRWVKVPQVGKVVLGDDVEVGANTTIDRGAIDDTVIGTGVKLDNLIQVGHNVQIGDHTAIAACTAVAGSTRIGKGCAIGGCVGIVGHLEIADNVTITGMSHVSQSVLEAGVYSSGTPLEKNAQWHRNFVRLKQLDDMSRRLKMLEKQMGAIEHLGEKKNNE
ncbi:MAG: UDP-3-O-(3-hydroxymyristoyl)glucosamine N-acyltransferase [Gammaproteobacteria bacterium]|nr:UDP-3-O-(3-hydroxymyristoyl)glucosamine N-acyltransferase [Gammaproteobacteria bacterium]